MGNGVRVLLALFFLAGVSCAEESWSLVWSDEFGAPDGSAPDSRRWTPLVTGSGCGNNELEYYTDRLQNVRVENGCLVLEAHKERYQGRDGSRAYTSGRVHSSGKFSVKHGRVEARIRVPEGRGLWPAFWMLGDDRATVGWPECGEIDIMEVIGQEPRVYHTTLHGPGYSGAKGVTRKHTLDTSLGRDFHVYGLQWGPKAVEFFLDGKKMGELTPADIPPGESWVFEHPFYLILNLAVGGNWPGSPDDETTFPSRMEVDWVRVYRLER